MTSTSRTSLDLSDAISLSSRDSQGVRRRRILKNNPLTILHRRKDGRRRRLFRRKSTTIDRCGIGGSNYAVLIDASGSSESNETDMDSEFCISPLPSSSPFLPSDVLSVSTTTESFLHESQPDTATNDPVSNQDVILSVILEDEHLFTKNLSSACPLTPEHSIIGTTTTTDIPICLVSEIASTTTTTKATSSLEAQMITPSPNLRQEKNPQHLEQLWVGSTPVDDQGGVLTPIRNTTYQVQNLDIRRGCGMVISDVISSSSSPLLLPPPVLAPIRRPWTDGENDSTGENHPLNNIVTQTRSNTNDCSCSRRSIGNISSRPRALWSSPSRCQEDAVRITTTTTAAVVVVVAESSKKKLEKHQQLGSTENYFHSNHFHENVSVRQLGQQLELWSRMAL